MKMLRDFYLKTENKIKIDSYFCQTNCSIMATITQYIYLTKKEKLNCKICGKSVAKGSPFVAETENHKGTCFSCSPFGGYVLLAPGDAAMTRRSKKHSTLCAVVLFWNQRRKRYERKGQLVEPEAIEKARLECNQDQQARDLKNKKAAEVRALQEKAYLIVFAEAIRHYYPYCPKDREHEIAKHACEKYSGRVGRTASAKQFDKKMIDLAVEAHIRHAETNYDNEFGKGKRKKEIRTAVKSDINAVLQQWRGK